MADPPLVNATLTKIEGGGTQDDYDQTSSADSVRFSGTANAYLDERVLTEINSGGALDEVKQTRLVIPLSIGDLAHRGDTVTFTQGANTYVRTVRDITHFRTTPLDLTNLFFRDV